MRGSILVRHARGVSRDTNFAVTLYLAQYAVGLMPMRFQYSFLFISRFYTISNEV